MTGPKKYKIGIFIAIFMVSIVVVTTVVLALTLYILSKELNSAACEILLHMLVCKFYHLPLLQILVRKFLFLLSNKKFSWSNWVRWPTSLLQRFFLPGMLFYEKHRFQK